ncbi:GntR family transcriptional regulator [Streptomyces telluris]|uniref:GntR family transcriptional regulator n=1 Tax=Streptomyces telluris TaxID=2720021 RepID=A0A9X2RMU8_9ACTN|nr:GntR family transcriptional regulator [Streptomyces telluris]MCQ8772258.1 GntR family transcriptional regulator [Streptomyces telluris]NJP75741.1 GntR family transcriptional regulator [Streptomyces telluris]
MATHHQYIADDLRRRIESGEFAVGERLPAETKLATRYRVSVPTLRVALDLLQAEGRVEKLQGRGNFVRPLRERTVYDARQDSSDRQAVQGPQLQVSVKVQTVNATSALSALLQVRRGALVSEFEYIGFLGTSVQSLGNVYVPHKVAKLAAPTGSLSPWGDDIRQLLAAAGVRVTSTVQRVVSRLPSAEEREIFRSPAPVLEVERISTDATGRVVEGTLLVLPGDRTEAVFSTGTRDEGLEKAG